MFNIVSDSYNSTRELLFPLNPLFEKARDAIIEVAKETPLAKETLDIYCYCNQRPLEMNPASVASIWSDHDIKIFFRFSPLWAIDWKGLPSHLSISGLEDPKLDNRDFIQEFSDWVANKLSLNKSAVSAEEIATLLTFIILKDDPEALKKTWRSMIAHELGHVYHKHSLKRVEFLRTAKKTAIIFAFIVTPILAYIGYKIASLLQTRKHEYEADAFAAQYLPDGAEGAIYGFTNAKQAIRHLKQSKAINLFEKIICNIMFIGDDDLSGRFTHGSLTTRMNRMQQIHQRKNC